MYVVVSDYTKKSEYIQNAVGIIDTFRSKENAIDAAEQMFLKCFKRYPDSDIDYDLVNQIDLEGYDSCTGAEITPFPIYVIGEAIDNGETYHCYYMVIETEKRPV